MFGEVRDVDTAYMWSDFELGPKSRWRESELDLEACMIQTLGKCDMLVQPCTNRQIEYIPGAVIHVP